MNPAQCDLDCLCKNCIHDDDSVCAKSGYGGTCDNSRESNNCPVSDCADWEEEASTHGNSNSPQVSNT